MLPSANRTFELLDAHIRVSSLKRAEAFYSGVLGLVARPGSHPGESSFSAAPGSRPLLTLREVPGAPPAPEDAAGLFHTALLVPTRADLARILYRLIESQTPLQGLSDHGVSEALYLADPDGNGVELYADRDPAAWPRQPDGRLAMFTRRLNVPSLVAEASDRVPSGLAAGTLLGHMHLRVTELGAAERFFSQELPLTVTTRDYPGALFLAADGYHHHIGTNTWGVTRPAPATPHCGLDSITVGVLGALRPARLQGPGALVVDVEPITPEAARD